MTQRLVENTLYTLAHFRLYRLRHRLFFQTMRISDAPRANFRSLEVTIV